MTEQTDAIAAIRNSIPPELQTAIHFFDESRTTYAFGLKLQLEHGLICGTRHPKAIIRAGTEYIKPPVTDVLTFGNGPCCILCADGKMLSHVPQDWSLVQQYMTLSPDVKIDHIVSQTILAPLNGKKVRTLLLLPGGLWSPQEAHELDEVVSHILPRTVVKVYSPAVYASWLGPVGGISPNIPIFKQKGESALAAVNLSTHVLSTYNFVTGTFTEHQG